MVAPGNRIYTKINRPDPALVKEFAALASANLSDVMSRSFCMWPSIKPLNKDAVLAGPALTIKARAGDNFFLHAALDLAKPGDVLVIDTEGSPTDALMGEIMAAYCKARGIAGIVTEGSVRDSKILSAMDNFHVFSSSIGNQGPQRDGPGEVNTIISCAGVVVRPGDIIVGDCDGVVVVEKKFAKDVLEAAKALAIKEAAMLEESRKGNFNRPWIEQTIKEKGIVVVDGAWDD